MEGTLQDLVDDLAARENRTALVVPGEERIDRWSYAELADRSRRLAAGLVEAGLGPGDAVAIHAANRPEWAAVALAVLRAGGVVAPLDAQLGRETLERLLEDSGANVVFTDAARLDRVEAAAGRRRVLLLDGDEGRESWTDLLSDRDVEFPAVEPEDTATLFYTSGTTGPPKGVPLSHRNLLFQVETIRASELVGQGDRVLQPLPFHHVYPFVIGLLVPLSLGLAIVLPRRLTGTDLLDALRKGRATAMIGLPRMYRALYETVERRFEDAPWPAGHLFRGAIAASTALRERFGLRIGAFLFRPVHRRIGPDLRILASGGSPLDPDLGHRLEALGWDVGVGYGTTETSPLLTLLPPGDGRLETVGRPIRGVEIRIEREEGSAEGEIVARGPGIFAGYHGLPDVTEKAFAGDGFFRTGDLGVLEEDEYLRVTGRASERIVLESGETLQPAEVEEAYEKDPLLAEVGVLEVEGRLVAVVVPDPAGLRRRGGDAARAVGEAIAERSRRLPTTRRIAEFALTREPLPRTRLGKLRRHRLAERYDLARREGPGRERGPLSPEEMRPEDRQRLEEPAAREVWNWLARRYVDRPLSPDADLQLDLGVDSIERLEWAVELRRRVGVELDEDAIGRIARVRDLLDAVAGAEPAEPAAGPEEFLDDPLSALDESQRRWLAPLDARQRILARALMELDRALMGLLFRVRADGLDRLPERGPCVLCPNHTSLLDPCVLAAVLPPARLARLHWAGFTAWTFGNPVTRAFSRIARVFPVDPERAVVSNLAFAAAVLRQGEDLVWFPEGERSPTGELRPLQKGLGHVLEHHRVPVVPVLIRGTHEAMPVGQLLPLPRPIEIAFDRPVHADGLESEGEGDTPADRIVDGLRRRLEALVARPEVATPRGREEDRARRIS